jgi:hypothetical protein
VSCGRSLSRDLLTAKTTTANAQIIKNSTQNRLYERVPSGVAMSELSNGTKKHTLKSRETLPLINAAYLPANAILKHCCQVLYAILKHCCRGG